MENKNFQLCWFSYAVQLVPFQSGRCQNSTATVSLTEAYGQQAQTEKQNVPLKHKKQSFLPCEGDQTLAYVA